jgi:electron transfer flavoprotein beta subunit
MKILVCVKWISDPVTIPEIDDLAEIVRPKRPFGYRANRYDEYAIEEALRIKEAISGTWIDALTVGPPECSEALVRALGMGADHGIHILVGERACLEAFAVASGIAAYARPRGYDLILTGVISEDFMQSQVGPMIAELITAPCATAVVHINPALDGSSVTVERELEGGVSELVELALPAVLTIESGTHIPRYPKLSYLLRAKKYPFERIEGRELAVPESRQELIRLSSAQRSRAGRILEGGTRDRVQELVAILDQRGLLR